jgi:type II secretory pathway component GspD/PulD (secretin)
MNEQCFLLPALSRPRRHAAAGTPAVPPAASHRMTVHPARPPLRPRSIRPLLLRGFLLCFCLIPPGHAATAKATAKPLTVDTHKSSDSPGDIYLSQVRLDEAARLISQIGHTSIVVTAKVSDQVVSLYLRDVSVEGMVKNLCRAAGVWYRYDAQTHTYLLMSAEEYQRDIAITRDDVTRTFVLRHHNVVAVANAIKALFGTRVALSTPVEETPPTSLGGTSRSQTGAGNKSSSGNSNTSSSGNSNANSSSSTTTGTGISLQGSNEGTSSRSTGGTYGSSANNQLVDPRKEMANISQERIDAVLHGNAGLEIGAAELIAAAARQGPPISVTYNKLHNLLLIRSGDEAAIRDIESLVAEMDRPPRQVLLEMQILEVELDNDFASVFDIGLGGSKTSSGPLGLGFGTTSGATTNSAGSTVYPKNAASSGNFDELDDPTFVWQFISDAVRLRLQLLESEQKVNVLASPMVVAANNQPARLFIGDEQVLVTGASADSTTGTTGATTSTITVETEQRNVGQTLIVLPRINADRSVTLTIDQDNSRVNSGATTLPLAMPDGTIYQFPIDTVNTANLQLTAHARDGLTVAIGGMISQTRSDTVKKVPVLGDIPGLGVLFRSTVKSNTRSQIVLLITPHVLETPEEGDAIARERQERLQRLDRAGKPHASIFDAEPPAREEKH